MVGNPTGRLDRAGGTYVIVLLTFSGDSKVKITKIDDTLRSVFRGKENVDTLLGRTILLPLIVGKLLIRQKCVEDVSICFRLTQNYFTTFSKKCLVLGHCTNTRRYQSLFCWRDSCQLPNAFLTGPMHVLFPTPT